MGRPGMQMETWVLFVAFGCMCVGQALADPLYFVPVPAVWESGAQVRFCASLLKVEKNDKLEMKVTLLSPELNTTLLQKESNQDFHTCSTFLAPLVIKDTVQHFQVEVIGKKMYSRETRKVLIRASKPVTFIQTDKPIFLPGQTVHFRVVTVDTKLRPACRKYDIIELQDPNGNRIGQWLNLTTEGKIVQQSFALNFEAKEGSYQLSVTSGEDTIFHSFKVEKYVLPKFDVKITSNDKVSIAQEEISIKACAEYTYRQPVPGIVKIDVCRPINRYMFGFSRNEDDLPSVTAPCHKESKTADTAGCAVFTIPMSTFKEIDQKVLQDTLEVVVDMEEEGTGITFTQHKRVTISFVVGTLSFFDTPNIYEKDSTLHGKVKAVAHNEQPLVNRALYLFEGELWSSRHLRNLTTDNNGVATFSLDTSAYSGEIHLHISITPVLEYPKYREEYYENGDIHMTMAQQSTLDTKTVSSLEVKKNSEPFPCDTEQDIFINYSVVKEMEAQMDIMYLVYARDTIVTQSLKRIQVKPNTVTEGSFSFKLQITADLAPVFTVVTYAVLPSKFPIAHSAIFETEKCFNHKVKLDFTPAQGVPGEKASLKVTASAWSLCGISVIDQSVLIQEPDRYLKPETIYNLLPVNNYVPYEIQDQMDCLSVRPKRSILPFPVNKDDAHTVFQNAGLKMVTNVMIRVPDCLKYLGREYFQGHGFAMEMDFKVNRMEDRVVAMASPNAMGAADGAGGLPSIVTVRTFFPETWIWDLVEVGTSGFTDKPITVPDTITTWETEAFCLSSKGFGLAPRVQFTVFQPFFLELTLPYSIIRGERFILKATVFSYLESCMMVAVNPIPGDYTLTPVGGAELTFCLCGNQRVTRSWTLDASNLGTVNVTVRAEAVASPVSCNNEIVHVPPRGRVDEVTRPLIVKPEGIEMSSTHNLLLCPKDETLTEELAVKLPEDMIPDSARGAVSVLGDILGRAMKNLDGLLQMPYGCGEQNMALLAPNIYILEYLEKTNQLTQEIRDRAEQFLTSGYQRQLNYKHSDGAYSTFGTGTGNTWLTAFVVRTFVKAKNFVHIDQANIDESKMWLESKQENGCFAMLGKLFHNRMKGGVSDNVTLTAYISAALLEMGVPADNEKLSNALTCLKESMNDLSNTYTTALMAYVFTLANDLTTRTQLLDHLNTKAHREGGMLHWSQTSAETSASLSVEISAYVLLALLGNNPGPQDLGVASNIVRWLTKQQNYYGGFSSTQDTVVALQALSLYSTLVYSPGGQSTVTIISPSGSWTFDVNQNNKLLYQEATFKKVDGDYSVSVQGNTCAAIQIALMYNIPTPTITSAFKVDVTHKVDCDSNLLRPKMNLNFKLEYNGDQETSNMVILNIKMLSGFKPDSRSLKELESALLVERIENDQKDNDHYLVYLKELPKGIPINYQLVVVQEREVSNLKPAVVLLYDYYQPSDSDETEYSYPCA